MIIGSPNKFSIVIESLDSDKNNFNNGIVLLSLDWDMVNQTNVVEKVDLKKEIRSLINTFETIKSNKPVFHMPKDDLYSYLIKQEKYENRYIFIIRNQAEFKIIGFCNPKNEVKEVILTLDEVEIIKSNLKKYKFS